MTFIEITKKATTETLTTMRDKEWDLIDRAPDCPEMAEYIDAAFVDSSGLTKNSQPDNPPHGARTRHHRRETQ